MPLRSFLTTLGCLFGLLLPSVSVGDEAIMEMVGATYKVKNSGSNATTFLVKRPSNDGKFETIWVTAAHVLQQASGDQCKLVLRDAGPGDSFKQNEIKVQVRSDGKPLWTQHHAADVAAMRIEVPDEFDAQAIPYDAILNTANCEGCGLELGQRLWVLCYPAQLASSRSGFPVLRSGTVASYPLVEREDHRRFMLDYSTFGGDSGGPVFRVDKDESGSRPTVVGLIHGQHRETTKSVTPVEERVFHRPLGLAIVVHAKYIRETIDQVK